MIEKTNECDCLPGNCQKEAESAFDALIQRLREAGLQPEVHEIDDETGDYIDGLEEDENEPVVLEDWMIEDEDEDDYVLSDEDVVAAISSLGRILESFSAVTKVYASLVNELLAD
jgi:hypothetical protein